MAFTYFRKFINRIYNDYSFSDFSKIRRKSFDEYVRLLNPKQTLIYQEGDLKKIEWQDDFTLYIAVFDKNGEFITIEREVWYEYKFPLFKKRVILDTIDISGTKVFV